MQSVAVRETGARGGPAFEVAPGVACLQLSIVNVYFVGEAGAGDRSWVLVDTVPVKRHQGKCER